MMDWIIEAIEPFLPHKNGKIDWCELGAGLVGLAIGVVVLIVSSCLAAQGTGLIHVG